MFVPFSITDFPLAPNQLINAFVCLLSPIFSLFPPTHSLMSLCVPRVCLRVPSDCLGPFVWHRPFVVPRPSASTSALTVISPLALPFRPLQRQPFGHFCRLFNCANFNLPFFSLFCSFILPCLPIISVCV